MAAVAGIVWTNDAAGRMKGDQPGWSLLTGQTSEEYAEFGWANAVHPDDAMSTLSAWNTAVEEKRLFAFEHRVRTVDGEWRLFSIRASPVLGPNGDIEEWVGVHTDVTDERRQKEELRRLAAELSESSRRKTEFLAVLAHELRNPLAPIRTGLDLIGMSPDNPAMLKRTREMMGRQVNHMVHLIDDLMDVARISSGKMELKRELVALEGIVSSAIEASAPHLEASSHTLSVSLPDPAIVLFADHVRIAQVLSNLLTNAGKYTPKGGDISLSAQCVGETLTIAINDNGMGIPKEALGSVFDMFTQVNRMLGHANGGLGIGLSIVKQLVELHGGSVGVSSDGPNLGSTFIITLPLATRAQSPENLTRDGRLEQATTMRTLKILVADDNFDAASSLADLLLLRGHDVILANDGKEALVKACEAVPDIIFLDIGMPGLTGLEVARAIRRSPAYEQMILVALTGWGTELDRERTRQAGCNHHFTKPIDLAAVDQLLLTIAQN